MGSRRAVLVPGQWLGGGLSQRPGGLAWGLCHGSLSCHWPALASGSRPQRTCSRSELSSCSSSASPGLKLAAWLGIGAQIPPQKIGFPPTLPATGLAAVGAIPGAGRAPPAPAPQAALRAASARPAPGPGAEPQHMSPLRVPAEGLWGGTVTSALVAVPPRPSSGRGQAIAPGTHGCPGDRAVGGRHRTAGGAGGAPSVLCRAATPSAHYELRGVFLLGCLGPAAALPVLPVLPALRPPQLVLVHWGWLNWRAPLPPRQGEATINYPWRDRSCRAK